MDCLRALNIVLWGMHIVHRRGHVLLLRLHELMCVHRLRRCLDVLNWLRVVRLVVHGLLLLIVLLQPYLLHVKALLRVHMSRSRRWSHVAECGHLWNWCVLRCRGGCWCTQLRLGCRLRVRLRGRQDVWAFAVNDGCRGGSAVRSAGYHG